MDQLDLDDVNAYVNLSIVDFHEHRIKSLERLSLDKLLKKNPYLFKAKMWRQPDQLIEGLLDAFLLSSEESYSGIFWRISCLRHWDRPVRVASQQPQVLISSLSAMEFTMWFPSSPGQIRAIVRNTTNYNRICRKLSRRSGRHAMVSCSGRAGYLLQ